MVSLDAGVLRCVEYPSGTQLLQFGAPATGICVVVGGVAHLQAAYVGLSPSSSLTTRCQLDLGDIQVMVGKVQSMKITSHGVHVCTHFADSTGFATAQYIQQSRHVCVLMPYRTWLAPLVAQYVPFETFIIQNMKVLNHAAQLICMLSAGPPGHCDDNSLLLDTSPMH